MHDGNTLGDAIKERKRPFRELTWKEKIWYIREYYRVYIILGLIFAIIAGSLLYHYIFELRDTLIYGMTINVATSEDTVEDFTSDYLSYADADKKEYEVIFENNLYMGTDNGIDASSDYGTVMKTSSVIAARQLDFLLCNTDAFENYEAVAGFYDLKELLPEDLYAQLEAEGRIIVGQPTNEESALRMDEYAMAIDITDTEFAETYSLNPYQGGSLYLGIITNTKRPEECVNLIRYIFGMDYVPVTNAE